MERIIERSEKIIPQFLTENQFNYLRENYSSLLGFIETTMSDEKLTPNQKSVLIYDIFESGVPAFLSRFYCIVGRAYIYDLRENVWEKEREEEMIAGLKVYFNAAGIDINEWFRAKYLSRNDLPKVILRSFDTGCYWLITKKFIDALIDYLKFVKTAKDFKTYCATVKHDFLWTNWWKHRFVTFRYPDAYGGSVEDIRANFEY